VYLCTVESDTVLCYAWCVDDVEMADLKKLEEDALGFAQQAISLDQQGLYDMAFFYYCVRMILFISDIFCIAVTHRQHP